MHISCICLCMWTVIPLLVKPSNITLFLYSFYFQETFETNDGQNTQGWFIVLGLTEVVEI